MDNNNLNLFIIYTQTDYDAKTSFPLHRKNMIFGSSLMITHSGTPDHLLIKLGTMRKTENQVCSLSHKMTLFQSPDSM